LQAGESASSPEQPILNIHRENINTDSFPVEETMQPLILYETKPELTVSQNNQIK